MLRYSDKRTITGRINCVDRFNPQMLPKDSSIREQMISRYNNGKIVIFDYKSFETRLSMYLSRDEEFIITNMNSDLHLNTAKAIFQHDDLNNEQRKLGKDINHAILYGGGNALLKNIISESNIEDVDESISRVKNFLEPILNTSNYINDVYKELGYIINPFGTLIKPNKSYAAFNNYVQSTAADIVVDKISEIKDWLKNKSSSFMFQVHDSFVLDISPEDLNATEEIKSILSKYNDMVFDIEVLSGKNYMECN
jgi:DNA polymerase I-like protein with 3'-5' exonuclease and polymerase domains